MNKQYGRADLARIAAKAMVDRGLVAEFSTASLNQLAAFDGSHQESAPDIRDLRALLWCSIDNEESRDLDQLTVCERLPNGAVKVSQYVSGCQTEQSKCWWLLQM
ncbi:MAG: hypothetical protein RI918_510 [Pseudomonadota bacterium]